MYASEHGSVSVIVGKHHITPFSRPLPLFEIGNSLPPLFFTITALETAPEALRAKLVVANNKEHLKSVTWHQNQSREEFDANSIGQVRLGKFQPWGY